MSVFQHFLLHYLKNMSPQKKRKSTIVLSVKNWTRNRHSDSHCWGCPKPVQTGLTGKTIFLFFFIFACSYSGADNPKNITINISFSWAFKGYMSRVDRRSGTEKCPLWKNLKPISNRDENWRSFAKFVSHTPRVYSRALHCLRLRNSQIIET